MNKLLSLNFAIIKYNTLNKVFLGNTESLLYPLSGQPWFFGMQIQYTICSASRFMGPCWVGYVVSLSASHRVGSGFVFWQGHTKDHHINGTNYLRALHTCVGVVV